MTFPAHPPTLCPCGRHKDRCRCAGRREAMEEVAAIVEGDGWWGTRQLLAERIRALANGAP
jgi:hypothetical protein